METDISFTLQQPGGLTAAQCRAARALVDWSQADLARQSGVGCSTIRSFEQGRHALMRANHLALWAALERVGVVFVAVPGIGAGVILRAAAGDAAALDDDPPP